MSAALITPPTPTALAALLGVVALSTAAQFLLRAGVRSIDPHHGVVGLVRSVRPSLVLAAAAMIAAPLLYYYALARVELGFAYFLTALTQAAVAIGGRFVPGERPSAAHFFGIALVIAGLAIWNL